MSGRLNVEFIVNLRTAFQDYTSHGTRLRDAVVRLGEAEAEIKICNAQRADLLDRIKTLMREMDVMSTGNAGYEDRRFELLRMMSVLHN